MEKVLASFKLLLSSNVHHIGLMIYPKKDIKVVQLPGMVV